ncbi:MAG: ABC transporter permease [Anaerolineae bacterium]|jgi:peptide/nickel transport system permease protein|nr:ABC transporter permease [Anaerolineae bacterium]
MENKNNEPQESRFLDGEQVFIEEMEALESSEEFEFLTVNQLMKLKFKKNKAAVISLYVLALFYFVIIFAEFFAPYEFNTRIQNMGFAPPQAIHIRDSEGRFRLPFTYALKQERNMDTYLYEYVNDTSQIYPLKFFVKGHPYKLLGLFETDIHFLGVEEGGTLLLLGTDQLGRDMFSRVLVGGRISLTVGLIGVVLTIILGSFLGTVSGYYGGWVDNVIQRIAELLRAFPTLPLWMTLTTALPREWPSHYIYFGIVTVLAIIGWTGLAREIRGKVMAFRNTDFVLAAEAQGASTLRIIFLYMIPNMVSHIMVIATLSIPGMILGESALSYLGLGIQPPMTSWGLMMAQAQKIEVMKNYPWLMLPGVFLFVVVLAFNFLGDGLRDAVDPFAQ